MRDGDVLGGEREVLSVEAALARCDEHGVAWCRERLRERGQERAQLDAAEAQVDEDAVLRFSANGGAGVSSREGNSSGPTYRVLGIAASTGSRTASVGARLTAEVQCSSSSSVPGKGMSKVRHSSPRLSLT